MEIRTISRLSLVLLVCLTITVVTVVVSMFETLAWLMG